MTQARRSHLLWILVSVLFVAVPVFAMTSGQELEATTASQPLPFLLGAPPPLVLMAVGTLMVALTVGRRLSVLRRLDRDG